MILIYSDVFFFNLYRSHPTADCRKGPETSVNGIPAIISTSDLNFLVSGAGTVSLRAAPDLGFGLFPFLK